MDVKATSSGYVSGPTEQRYAEANVDFNELFARIRRRRWWVLGSVCVFTAIFVVIALTTAPVYRASTVLAAASEERNAGLAGLISSTGLGGLASNLGLGGPRDAETEEALAVLRSREFTEAFIAKHNLMPEFYADRWDKARGTWKADAKAPTPSRAYKFFDKIRSVAQDKKTGLISIEIEWTDRNEAAEWVNDLVRQLNDEMRARAVKKADASMQFLSKELQTSPTVEERNALNHLVESQVKQRMLANVTQDYSFTVVDRAIASDKDDPVKPQKKFLVIVGAALGLFLGAIAAVLAGGVRQPD